MATLVTAPMPGKVLELKVKVGDTVQEDDTILTIEAMKMEIPIVAPASGTVTEIKVAPGQAVDSEEILATMA
jgi:biotin carboxyl carrier protein